MEAAASCCPQTPLLADRPVSTPLCPQASWRGLQLQQHGLGQLPALCGPPHLPQCCRQATLHFCHVSLYTYFCGVDTMAQGPWLRVCVGHPALMSSRLRV